MPPRKAPQLRESGKGRTCSRAGFGGSINIYNLMGCMVVKRSRAKKTEKNYVEASPGNSGFVNGASFQPPAGARDSKTLLMSQNHRALEKIPGTQDRP